MIRFSLLLTLLLLVTTNIAFTETHTVRVVNHKFVPKNLQINIGDSVRWVWEANFHDVISGNDEIPNGFFRSPLQNKGASFEVVFDRFLLESSESNTFDYYCEPHVAMDMVGRIKVNEPEIDINSVLSAWQADLNSKDLNFISANFKYSPQQKTITLTSPLNTPIGLSDGDIGFIKEAFCNFQNNGDTCSLTDELDNSLVAGNLYFHAQNFQYRSQIILDYGDKFSISGTVLSADNSLNVQDVKIYLSNGNPEFDILVPTSSNGSYIINNIANGVYLLRAEKQGFNFIPFNDVNPVIVNNGNLIFKDFAITEKDPNITPTPIVLPSPTLAVTPVATSIPTPSPTQEVIPTLTPVPDPEASITPIPNPNVEAVDCEKLGVLSPVNESTLNSFDLSLEYIVPVTTNFEIIIAVNEKLINELDKDLNSSLVNGDNKIEVNYSFPDKVCSFSSKFIINSPLSVENILKIKAIIVKLKKRKFRGVRRAQKKIITILNLLQSGGKQHPIISSLNSENIGTLLEAINTKLNKKRKIRKFRRLVSNFYKQVLTESNNGK